MNKYDPGLWEDLQQNSSVASKLQMESEENLVQLEDLVREARRLRAKWAVHVPIIHVVDDDEEFQIAISRLLQAAGYVVRAYRSAADLLIAELDDSPGCILLDLRLPGVSGLDLQRVLASRQNPLPIIFLSGYGDIPTSVAAIKAGAADFLTKPVPRETLLAAIRNAVARCEDNRHTREQVQNWRARYQTLTKREAEVFERVVAGKMNKEIALEIGAAERTVKAHRAQVMEKMRAGSLAELVQIAGRLQNGRATALRLET